MKKMPVIIVILSLLAINMASVMHAHASMKAGNEYQVSKSMDDSSEGNTGNNSIKCDMCICNNHCGHSNMIVIGFKYSSFLPKKAIQHQLWEGNTYLSQLNYPPSKPPKA